MNEKILWEKFAESGKINDYIVYSEAKNETAEHKNDNSKGNCS